MSAKTAWELEQEIERLEKDLDGEKAYYYKEEVWRDSNRLAKLKAELKQLEEVP